MRRRGERGTALISVMVLMVAVAAMVSLTQVRSLTLARDSAVEKGRMEALHAAEGGLALARHALRSHPEWKGQELRVGTCEVSVSATRAADGQWKVTAKATARPTGDHGNPVRVTLVEEVGTRYRYLPRPR